MMRKYLICAVAGLAMAACNNDEENMAGVDDKPTAGMEREAGLVPLNTRGSMQLDLSATWQTASDKGTTAGDTVGVFSYYDNGGVDTQIADNSLCTYQSWVNGIGQTTKAFKGPKLGWWNTTSEHTFYVYYPYVSGVTKESIPFTVSNVQTQPKADEWDNNNGKYNFMYYSTAIPLVCPADNAIPFAFTRLLPVAEFNIIRDGNKLDGYYLQSIKLETPTVNDGLKTGNMRVNLNTAATYNSLPFTYTTNVKDYTVYTTSNKADYTKGMLMSNAIGLNNSFSVYMSVNPCTLANSTITAVFSDGSNSGTVDLKRTGDKFVVKDGKGNIERYYLYVENAVIHLDNVIGSTENTTINGEGGNKDGYDTNSTPVIGSTEQ